MYSENSTVKEFFLVSFENIHSIRVFFFSLVLTVYFAILIGNFLIVTLVHMNGHLWTPMYIFLSHLSISEILFTSNIIPKLLEVTLHDGGTISLSDCITQYYMFSSSTTAECLLLSFMSYDRYLAICNPFNYTYIMTQRLCHSMISCSWLTGFMISLPAAFFISMLRFCGPNVIDHFFCDLAPILQLSCSDTSVLEIEDLVLSFPILVFPLVFIAQTYILILFAILKIKSTSGKRKSFSTCSSHLMVVCTYYGTLIIVYMIPSFQHSLNKVLALLYTVVTPLLNPVIYSLRNQEIRAAIMKFKRQF
ncbi:olfactory receptor 11A1-like [Ranitomeya imitator]|uniref:olfactory receptor 11A1-like n=1 Tax=Ranitomeya imitator TaxID=111125 RepID=UPI0037E88215